MKIEVKQNHFKFNNYSQFLHYMHFITLGSYCFSQILIILNEYALNLKSDKQKVYGTYELYMKVSIFCFTLKGSPPLRNIGFLLVQY